jgi:hypothetical protein
VTVSGKASAVDRLSALSSCLPIILQWPLRQNQLQQHRKRRLQSCSHQAAFQVGSLVKSSTLISRGQLLKIADRIEKVESANWKKGNKFYTLRLPGKISSFIPASACRTLPISSSEVRLREPSHRDEGEERFRDTANIQFPQASRRQQSGAYEAPLARGHRRRERVSRTEAVAHLKSGLVRKTRVFKIDSEPWGQCDGAMKGGLSVSKTRS